MSLFSAPTTTPPSLLLVHDDGELLDLLTRLFEARGFSVSLAATAFSATRQLHGRRELDVVIAGWETGRTAGAEVYRWVLAHRFSLRSQFVFLASDPPADYDALVQGRCLILPPTDVEEIVRVSEATAQRSRRLRELGEDDLAWMDVDRPTLLLVDDDPLILDTMARVLGDCGFSVTPAESGNAAIAVLARGEHDVIVSDWFMPDGSGADLCAWLAAHRPALLPRLVFLGDTRPADFAALAPGRVWMPKGQDSPLLVRHLRELARIAKTSESG